MAILARTYLLSLIVVLGLAACESPEEKEKAHFQRGVEYFSAGDQDRALIEFRNVTQLNASNAQAYYYIGRIHETKKEWPKTFFNYLKVIEFAPEHVDTNIRLGRMYVLAGDDEQALERAEAALAVEAENAEALALRAAVALRQERPDQARDDALRALRLDPDNVSAISVLVAYHRSEGRDDEALSLLEEGLAASGGDVSLRLLKAALHIDRRELDAAEAELRILVDEDPENEQYWISLAKLHGSSGRLWEAESVLREAVVAKPGATTKLLLVEFLESQGRLDTAEKELRGYLDADPGNMTLRFALADFHVRHDRQEAAEELLKALADGDGTDADAVRARIYLARLDLKAGDRSSAEALIGRVLEVEPQNPDALLIRAQVRFDEGRYEEAVADLRRALREDPSSVGALALLAEVHWQQGDLRLAVANLTRLVELQPDSRASKLRLSQILARQGDLEAALRYLNESVEGSPLILPWLTTKAEVLVALERFAEVSRIADEIKTIPGGEAVSWALRAKAAFARGDFQASVEAFEKAREIDPKSRSLLLGLAEALTRLDRGEEALGALTGHLESQPDDGEVWLRLGDTGRALGRPAVAEEAYRRVVETNPDSSVGYLRLAATYARQDRHDESVEVLGRGATRIPGSEPLRVALALGLENLGRIDEAMAAYRDYLESNPRSAVSANNLAALVADHRKDDPSALEEALALVEPFQTLQDPRFLDTIGWLHYRRGETSQSIAFLRRALDLAPENPEFNYHIGMAFLAQGESALARSHLEKAAAGGEHLPFAEEVKKALAAAVGGS